MIEVIYKEENQETQNGEGTFGLPRNIRQIGLIREDYKIYMEDYVYTFLVRLARAEEEGKTGTRVAVLTGETRWQGGATYLFVKGAVMAENMEAAPDHIDFSAEVWQKINEEQKKYFEDQEVVGWFFSQPQLSVEVTEFLLKVHLKNFGGEKVLMLMEPQEREDAFFHYENNVMVRLGGYYLYYEKNPCMQSYMLDKNKVLQPDSGENYEDKAVKDFRKIITDKNGEKKERETPSVFSYGVTACLALAVLAVGVNFYRNYEGLRQREDDSMTASSVIVEEITPSPEESGKNSAKDSQSSSGGKKRQQNTVQTSSSDLEKTGKDEKNQKGKAEEAKDADTDNTKQAISESSDKTEQVPVTQKNDTDATPEGDFKDAAEQEDYADTTAQSGNQSLNESRDDNTEQIYQEESDERKAQKRVREAAQKENENAASGTAHESYVIQPGDTLFQISMDRYGSIDAIAQICALNGMTADEIIYPGEIIVLP